MILPLTGNVLRSAWPWIETQLARRPVAFTPTELLILAQAGHLTVWSVVLDGEPVAVIMLLKDQDGFGYVEYCAGERMNEWLAEAVDTVREWCEWNQVSTLRVEGRKGWRRALLKHGFEIEDDQWAVLRPKIKR